MNAIKTATLYTYATHVGRYSNVFVFEINIFILSRAAQTEYKYLNNVFISCKPTGIEMYTLTKTLSIFKGTHMYGDDTCNPRTSRFIADYYNNIIFCKYERFIITQNNGQ